MIDRQQAAAILQVIELATEGNWPNVRDGLLESGYEPREVCEAVNCLAEIAGMSPAFTEEDF